MRAKYVAVGYLLCANTRFVCFVDSEKIQLCHYWLSRTEIMSRTFAGIVPLVPERFS